MRISDEQVQKALDNQRHAVVGDVHEMDVDLEPSPKATDGPMIKQIVQEVINMPDREDRIAEVKAAIEAGTYNPTGEEIADAMIKRAIADRVR